MLLYLGPSARGGLQAARADAAQRMAGCCTVTPVRVSAGKPLCLAAVFDRCPRVGRQTFGGIAPARVIISRRDRAGPFAAPRHFPCP